MVNKYLLAFLLTAILVVIGFSFTRYLDEARFKQISAALEESALEEESTQQLLLYESIYHDSKDICHALFKRVDLQAEKTRQVLSELEKSNPGGYGSNLALEQVSPGNSDPDFQLLKRRYLNQSIGLYLLMEKAINECNKEGIYGVKPLVFFYSDKEYCPDCIAQGKILDSIRDECKNIRVFVFPNDLGLPLVEVLKARYSVSGAPALVFEGEKLEGLSSKGKVKGFVGCS